MLQDERAVSSVLGEMLMLSITILLASVVILSISSLAPLEHTPYMDIKLVFSNGSLTLEHVGGEAVGTDRLIIRIFNDTDGGYLKTFNSTAFDPDRSDVGSFWMFSQCIVLNNSTLNSTAPFEVVVLYENNLLLKQEVYQ